MGFILTRALILLVCIFFLASELDKVQGVVSVKLGFGREQEVQGKAPQSRRSLKTVGKVGMNAKKSSSVTKTFDPNMSSKRKVRGGSDPIHNRS
ncbi:hypothetical protein EUGRSUZ_B03446 [Eucalyptus grandis]|uniref:Uncharacterized protein n=2 Tax=Eucalyptus grandis TaxID=71139 RepID=A0ACC3LVT6_EUCGR|nr:hypothetical protein EUGRSUZ_B03446 [Eucalyptus grandis]